MRLRCGHLLGVIVGLTAAVRPATAGQSMPVIDRWNQWNHGSLTIVTPDPPDSVRWVQTPVTGIPTRVLSVADWLKEKGPREHEQTLLLYRRDEAAAWPADVFAKKGAKCPRRPAEIPGDEVCAVAWPYGGHEWGILLHAPDEQWLKNVYAELLPTDMNRFATDGAAVVSFRVLDAVGVARDPRLVDDWLSRQGSRSQRVRGRMLAPAGLPGDGSAETPLTVVALTYEQYKQLSEADRKALAPLLSPGAAAALQAGRDNVVCSEVQRDGGRIRVCVVAPAERFLRFALSAPSDVEAA
ncbi:MAG: hypothetical protein HYU66_18220, partial [Armatimonadetes bacterium]|nr:hypothetical protein [Armatimonadota bacterium]